MRHAKYRVTEVCVRQIPGILGIGLFSKGQCHEKTFLQKLYNFISVMPTVGCYFLAQELVCLEPKRWHDADWVSVKWRNVILLYADAQWRIPKCHACQPSSEQVFCSEDDNKN